MRYRTAVLVLAALGPAGPAPGAEPPGPRARGDLAIRAREVFRRHCAGCHTGGAGPGLSRLNLMDHKQLGRTAPVPLAAPNGRSLILDLVKDGSMPPANRPGPTAEEVATLEAWVAAGAPAYPEVFDDTYVLAEVASDFEARAAADGAAGARLRYVSLAHLVRDGHPLPDLAAAEGRLRDALGAAAGRPVAPEVVDPAATVFRIDTAALGWQTGELFERVEGRKPAGAVRLQPFDLVLMEYPFPRAVPGPVAARLEKLLGADGPVRQAPFVRGDWLAGALRAGNWFERAGAGDRGLTPLGRDVRALAALGRALARQEDPGDGPSARPFAAPEPVRASGPAPGEGPQPPLSAWYAGDVVPAKVPFVLTAGIDVAGAPAAGVKVDEPFRLRVACDRKVFFTLLMVQADGEVRVQPVQGGTVLQPNRERLLAPAGAGFVISSILGGGRTATEHFVLLASETEFPLPTIVRSKHLDSSVWRFLLPGAGREAFDPGTVVRKVIPVPVTRE